MVANSSVPFLGVEDTEPRRRKRPERDAKDFEGVGNGERGIPFPSRLGASYAPPAGSVAGPRPKLNFVESECQRSHLMARILMNFIQQFHSGCTAVYVILVKEVKII